MHDRPGPPGPRLRGAVRLEATARPDGGVRALVQLDPADERAYAAPLRAAAPFVAAACGPQAHANRVIGWRDGLPLLEPWAISRRRWSAVARRLARRARVVATADVRDCYRSMGPDAVQARLRAIGSPDRCVTGVEAWARTFADVGLRGLPVGPTASAILADAVLAAGDDALRAFGATHLRWVDDVAIFSSGRRGASAALDTLMAAWEQLGLEPNGTKTGVHTDPMAWVTEATGRGSLVEAGTLR